MRDVVESPRFSCALGGALATVRGLYRAIPVLHAGPGCGLQLSLGQGFAAGLQGAGYIGGNATPSTNTYEREVVFGGEERLREVLGNTIKIIDGDLYFVLTGCTSEIIGDDSASVVREFRQNGFAVAHAETAGFKGNSYVGYQAVWEALLQQLVRPAPRCPDLVNLFGIIPFQDVFWQGNLEEIARMLKRLGLKVNSFFIDRQGVEEIRSSSGAALNIVLSPWLAEAVVKRYQAEYEVPYLRYRGLPVGPSACADFLGQVGSALGLDPALVEQVVAEETAYVYDNYEKLLEFFARYRLAVLGDSNTALGITRFLVNDFGQLPALVVITDGPGAAFRDEIVAELSNLEYARRPKVIFEQDQSVIRREIAAANPGFVLGSSLDREAAQDLGVPHHSVSFPITERLVLNRSYAGYRGSVTLIEDLFSPR